ncbi:MAG: GDP-L-fucose synthase [Gammaproteobacteria bacterium]|nr:MAG: GDP-L-fucose synthase [Gammaproteobacteria bacterium]
MKKDSKIYVAGHRGLAGSAFVRALQRRGFTNLVLRTHQELDLTSQEAVSSFFASERPEHVFLCAAKVGGILANNTYPAEFIYQNLMIQSNVIHAAWKNGVDRLLFLGSSCIYPKVCPQPMRESYLLTGPLEPTNRPYALAKIAGIEMCWSYNRQYGTRYISVMPTNLYGPGDNFDLQNSHVLPALIRKMHEAKVSGAESVTVWGTGKPRREFLHSDDLAEAGVYLMTLEEGDYTALLTEDEPPLFNIGCGSDVSIRELAELVRKVVGFAGELVWDTEKPDGTQQKLLDISRISALGWSPSIDLETGITRAYQWFLDNDYRGG